MKKTTKKTTSPAPATNSSKPARRKPARTPATSLVAAPPVPTPAAPAVVRLPASEPRAVAPLPVQTKVVARVDVGFGNALFIRGDGPGLTWNQGVPMDCVAGDQWEITLGESAQPISFKVLINDMIWCTGPDSVAASGSTTTIMPEFA